MPELPEVERARKLSEEQLLGLPIQAVHVTEDDKVFDRSGVKIRKALTNRRVVEAGRTGKYLWLRLSAEGPPLVIVVHLGMSGSIVCPNVERLKLGSERYPATPSAWPPKHVKLRLVLESDKEWAFANRRRFGRVFLLSDVGSEPPLRDLGPDAWLALPSSRALLCRLNASKRAVKSILLDQSVLCGIGNWLADDILLRAKVDPHRRGHTLKSEEVKRLRSAIRHILKTAIDANANQARFPASWLFHQRWETPQGKESLRGSPVVRTRIGGRTTLFVPSRQS